MASNQRSKWDLVRFVTTLNTFGEVPFLGSFRWMQQLLGQRTVFPGMTLTAPKKQAVLIDTDDKVPFDSLHKQLNNRLALSLCSIKQTDCSIEQTHGEPVNVEQLISLLISSVDTIAIADTTTNTTLITEIAEHIRQATEETFQGAAENDTAENGTAENTVDWSVITQSVFDFDAADSDLSLWGTLDDVVMGGVSQGGVFLRTSQLAGTVAVFAGEVSTNNSGGFSSIRTQNFEPPYDLSGWSGIKMRVKGDGQRYKFIARNSDGWDSPAYIYSFDTVANTWCDIHIPFEAMVPTFRARSMPDAPPFDPAKVFSLQLMLSKFEYDRQLNPKFKAGPFELAVKNIGVYRPRQGVPLVVVGNQDETIRRQQQAALNESGLSYRFIEPDNGDIIEALAQALA
ncbi:MAG: CIA30 family protein [Cyanobacteria bacterium P01_A01_bin.116]